MPALRPFLTALVLVALATPVWSAQGSAPGQQPKATKMASVFVIQGVTGSTWSISVDDVDVTQGKGAAAKDVLGPFDWDAGTHNVTATDQDGREVTAAVDVVAGESLDVVLHRPVDASGEPLFTTFVNDLAPVKAGSGRLTVAHTAAAPPADIRVNGEVLLADVASAEEISTVVPTGVYPVDIVPTATDGPVVLGPVDLEVARGSGRSKKDAEQAAAEAAMEALTA